jgi:hypothetical protein
VIHSNHFEPSLTKPDYLPKPSYNLPSQDTGEKLSTLILHFFVENIHVQGLVGDGMRPNTKPSPSIFGFRASNGALSKGYEALHRKKR